MVLVVLDTSVVVAGLRSRQGASFRVLAALGAGRFEVVVSVPLVFEYEAALSRLVDPGLLKAGDPGAFVEYVCSVARRQLIFYLWRPLLRDPGDEMVAECAVAAGAVAVVTFNRRDFAPLDRLGIGVWSPGELLRRSGGAR